MPQPNRRSATGRNAATSTRGWRDLRFQTRCNGMELQEAISTLRAVRRLRPDPIPDDVLSRVLTAATWAPTGGNRQPWRIVAVKDAKKKQALEDLYRPYWEGYIVNYKKHME